MAEKVQLKLRIEEDLHKRLKDNASINNQSINAEVVRRLEDSFPKPPSDNGTPFPYAKEALAHALGIKTEVITNEVIDKIRNHIDAAMHEGCRVFEIEKDDFFYPHDESDYDVVEEVLDKALRQLVDLGYAVADDDIKLAISFDNGSA